MFETQEIIPAELVDLLPHNTTRAETALSRFPIHNLTKSEKIDIRIVQKGESGDTDIYWSVSPSRDFGEPRQLAYKLDTLVINRRIDEAAKPIPKVIRLGSLRDICKELDLSAGKASNDVKTALQQNASAFITAKVFFRGNDGSEQRFEASFTRYGLRFYGQSLPDGKRADAVYIILNDEYWNLLNRAQFRPLNYDYLKQLTPSAQRFYEIVSFKVFAALSQNRKQAKLRYSEYCTRAPQRRYIGGTQMRKQMYKIHQPHVRSAYIEDVEYRNITGEDGQPDWEILYTPGKKARAEFYAFSKNARKDHRKLEEQGPKPPVPSPEESQSTLLEELTRRGVTEKKADALIKTLPSSQAIQEQLLWADSVVASSRGGIRNPPGFYIHVLEANLTPPQRLIPPKSRPSRPAAPVRAEEDTEYRSYQAGLVDQHIRDELGNERFEHMVEQKARELKRTLGTLNADTIKQVSVSTIRAALLKTISHVSAEEFTARRKAA